MGATGIIAGKVFKMDQDDFMRTLFCKKKFLFPEMNLNTLFIGLYDAKCETDNIHIIFSWPDNASGMCCSHHDSQAQFESTTPKVR